MQSSTVIRILLLLSCIVLLTILSISPSVSVDSAATEYVQTDTFANIKNRNVAGLVIFYHRSNRQAPGILATIYKVARKLSKVDFNPQFSFFKCDGDDERNVDDFAEASFSKEQIYIFTTVPVEGIMKYSGDITVKALTRHIKDKYLDFDPTDEMQFTDEDELYELIDSGSGSSNTAAIDSDSPKPLAVFIKYYETWCDHCKRLKRTFSQAASYFKPRGIQLMEIECSANEDSKSFCERNNVKNFPVLQLITSEDKFQFTNEFRTIQTFSAFFKQHVPEYKESIKPPVAAVAETAVDEDEEPVPVKKTAPAAKTTTKKTKPIKSEPIIDESDDNGDEDDTPVVVKSTKAKPNPNKKASKPVIVDDDDDSDESAVPVPSDPVVTKLGKFSKPTGTKGNTPAAASASAAGNNNDLIARITALETIVKSLESTVIKLNKKLNILLE